MKVCVIKESRRGRAGTLEPDGALEPRAADHTIESFLESDETFSRVLIHFGDVRSRANEVVRELLQRVDQADEVRWFSTAEDGLPYNVNFFDRVIEIEAWATLAQGFSRA